MVSVDLLRHIDRYIGIPACWVLTVVRLIAHPFRRHVSLQAPKRILIIKLSEMGSTVLAYPAIEELRRQIPDAEIFFLVFNNNRSIIDALNITRRDNIIAINVSCLKNLVSSGWDAFKRLRHEHVDTTIDMDFFSRFSAILAFLVCRGNRVGFHRFNDEGLFRGRLLTHKVLYSAHIHTSVAFMALAKALCNPDPNSRGKEFIRQEDFTIPHYLPSPTDIADLKTKLKECGIDVIRKGMRIVLVNPNSSDLFPLRKWPFRHFISLSSQLLSARNDIYVAITGSESERQDAEDLVDAVQNPRCINLAGKTTFSELITLYTISSLMITNDSGPAHFSALAQLPTIVLFGPETPALYAPLGKDAICLYSGFACSPCVSVHNAKASPCTRSLCLEAISIGEVFQCSITMLGKTPERESRA